MFFEIVFHDIIVKYIINYKLQHGCNYRRLYSLMFLSQVINYFQLFKALLYIILSS